MNSLLSRALELQRMAHELMYLDTMVVLFIQMNSVA